MGFQCSANNHSAVDIPQGRAATAAIAALSFFAVMLVLNGCSLERPEAPHWTVPLTVPLADRQYDVPYIIAHADQPELVWDSLSGARFELVRTLDTVYVGDNISFGDFTQSFADVFGPIALRPQQTLTTEIALGELYTGPLDLIPAFETVVERDLPPSTEIEQASIVQGVLRLQVTNALGLVIDSLELAVTNQSSGQEVGRTVFPEPVEDQSVHFADLDLAGKTISSHLRLTIRLRSAGGSIWTTEGKSLVIAAGFPDTILVDDGAAVIPPARRTFSDTIDFSQRIQASRAVFQRGTVLVELHNPSELEFAVRLRAMDLIRDGQPVEVAGSVSAESSASFAIPLAGATYQNPVVGVSRLRVELDLRSSGSTEIVHVLASDRFDVIAQVSSPVIETLTGVLPPTVQAVENLHAALDLPPGFEEAGFTGGQLQLEVLSSLPFPGNFDLQLSGNRGQYLALAGEILPAPAGQPLATAITIADASTLLRPIPTQIAANGTLIYGDGVASGTVGAADFLVPTLRLVAPLSLYLDGVRHVGEIEGIKLSDEQDELSGRLGAASITAEFENHLPFGVIIELRLADRRSDLPDNPDLVLGPTEISPAEIDSNGRTTRAVMSGAVLTVAGEQAGIFEQDSIFIIEEINLLTPAGRAVTVQDHDYLHWRALAQLETTLGGRD